MDGPVQIGDWQKISDLGSGAFGVVSLWKNNISNDFIAIKKCKFHQISTLTLKQKERWNQEVSIMKLINHPNIIKFKEIPANFGAALLKNNPTKLPLLSMEYCTKGNLRHLLLKPKNISGLEEQEVRDILGDVSSGLEHLHNLKITHRDIKPDNIVLQHCTNRKNNTIYKIIDLGYAKELNDSTVSFVGTLHYLAPEIFETVKYDSSVDYWSMGIVTFEIICGVLPFLPQLNPVERFPEIKKKASDDICIYTSYSGQITYSSEIKKENFISNCLKSNIEEWLKHVLQFDPTLRSENFPKDTKVFSYLQKILKKRIITIFSTYKLELYSYEIDDSTLISTLMDWVSRDIKSSKNDLILLLGVNNICLDDSKLLCDILGSDNFIYVIKRSAMINFPLTYNFPKLVKEFMKSAVKFDLKQLARSLYGQTIYYVITERNIAKFFKNSFIYYYNHLTHMVQSLKKHVKLVVKNMDVLLIKVECYSSIRSNNTCDIDINCDTEYKNYLVYNQRLLASLERSIINFKGLVTKIKIVLKRKKLLDMSLKDIVKMLDEYNVDKLYEQVIRILECTDSSKDVGIFRKMIIDVISNTIKVKDNLFKDKSFRDYISAISKVLKRAESISAWLKEFDTHIQELSESFIRSETLYRDILIELASATKKEKSPSVSSLNGELLDLPSEYLIKENQQIRYKFEAILSQSILAHKKYADSMKIIFSN